MDFSEFSLRKLNQFTMYSSVSDPDNYLINPGRKNSKLYRLELDPQDLRGAIDQGPLC